MGSSNFNKEYYNRLLNGLLVIKNNQDFLKSAFLQELEIQQAGAKMMEEAVKQGADPFERSGHLPEQADRSRDIEA
jgi:hypothetical protein